MILSVLTNWGTYIQHDLRYIALIREHLCVSIAKNAVKTNPQLFELGLSNLLVLIRFYRAQLKPEIEVLLNTIYLHILDMGNSTHKQKTLILQAVKKLTEDPQVFSFDIYGFIF